MVTALIVALTLTTLVATRPTIRNAVTEAICRVVTLGQGDCGHDVVADPHQPLQPCTTNSEKIAQSFAGTVGLIHGGKGENYEYARLGDGRIRVTQLADTAAGVEVGVGIGGSVSGFGRTVGARTVAQGSADLSAQSGKVWYLDEPGADDFFNAVQTEGTEDLLLGGKYSPKRLVWNAGQSVVNRIRHVTPVSIGTPDEVYYEGGVVLSGSAQASAGTGIDASVGVADSLGYRLARNGETTVYLHSTASASVAAQLAGGSSVIPPTIGANQDVDLVTAVTFDRRATLTAVTTTVDLDGSATGHLVYRANLPMTSAGDRATALSYLAATGITHLAVDSANVNLAVRSAPTVTAAVSDYLQSVRDHGQLTRQGFSTDPRYPAQDFGVSLDLEAGGGIGLGAGYSRTRETSSSADYWDGQAWTAWAGCR